MSNEKSNENIQHSGTAVLVQSPLQPCRPPGHVTAKGAGLPPITQRWFWKYSLTVSNYKKVQHSGLSRLFFPFIQFFDQVQIKFLPSSGQDCPLPKRRSALQVLSPNISEKKCPKKKKKLKKEVHDKIRDKLSEPPDADLRHRVRQCSQPHICSSSTGKWKYMLFQHR